MEDRWVIYATPPTTSPQTGDERSTAVTKIHICRSWTRREYICLTLTPDAPTGSNGVVEGKWGTLTEIRWETVEGQMWIRGVETEDGDTEGEVKSMAVAMCRALCKCELEGAGNEEDGAEGGE